MIGNLAFLGSPISLAQRIGSGFKDLIELPSEGFTISPLEGGKGLAKGAGSLVKNTFEGALNSVESVTGSVGNGLSALAFDDEFAKERQKIQSDKSQHIG
jgi:vacuolar protein sorting-associated protein 13A/C